MIMSSPSESELEPDRSESHVRLRSTALGRRWKPCPLLTLLARLIGRPVMSVSCPYFLTYAHLLTSVANCSGANQDHQSLTRQVIQDRVQEVHITVLPAVSRDQACNSAAEPVVPLPDSTERKGSWQTQVYKRSICTGFLPRCQVMESFITKHAAVKRHTAH